jgi:hypothetical protein
LLLTIVVTINNYNNDSQMCTIVQANLEARHKAAQKELVELKTQVDALLSDHKRFRELEEAAKADAVAKDARIKDLEEQVGQGPVDQRQQGRLQCESS